MTRFECLRRAGLTAFHSLMASAVIAGLAWILYAEGWLNADEFGGGIVAALILFAGGCVAAVVIAIAALALRDEDRP